MHVWIGHCKFIRGAQVAAVMPEQDIAIKHILHSEFIRRQVGCIDQLDASIFDVAYVDDDVRGWTVSVSDVQVSRRYQTGLPANRRKP